MTLLRTRWAAIGAAVAITLGAGGIGIVSATVNSGNRTVFVPITPCRIMDTRPAFAVGPKTSPLGPEEVYTVDARGTHGRCTLPNDASGLVLNVTATDATFPTFLAIWGDGARPNSSALNPSPGQPPTPNAVTTDLTGAGQFKIFNKQGNVNVFVDVVGYYANHNHDDRYYTKAQTDTALTNVDAQQLGGSPASQYPRFRAIIRMQSGFDGYTVVQGTDPAITVTSNRAYEFEVGEVGGPAQAMMESAICTAGFTPTQAFSVYKSLEIGTPPVAARLTLHTPGGSLVSVNGLDVYCTIWW